MTSSEWRNLLDRHPRIDQLHLYDKVSGLKGWIRLCSTLAHHHYDEVIDLHATLRTRIARIVFLFLSPNTEFRTLKKPRARRLFYIFLKAHCPRWLRPTPFLQLFAETAEVSHLSRPDFSFLGQKSLSELLPENFQPKRYRVVMPSSLWMGKCWPIEHFVHYLKKSNEPIVVVGSDKDIRSKELVTRLQQEGKTVYSGVGAWTLDELATVLKSALYYFGNDTGLAHLAQALGTPAQIIFGPTTPDFGFPPWLPTSIAIESPLWCRPCGKDGRACFRLWNRYQCLKELTPELVENQIASKFS